MEFKKLEIEIWLEEAEKQIKETLEKINDFNKYPHKHDLGEFEDLLYKLGYITGHRNTIEAILKFHEEE